MNCKFHVFKMPTDVVGIDGTHPLIATPELVCYVSPGFDFTRTPPGYPSRALDLQGRALEAADQVEWMTGLRTSAGLKYEGYSMFEQNWGGGDPVAGTDRVPGVSEGIIDNFRDALAGFSGLDATSHPYCEQGIARNFAIWTTYYTSLKAELVRRGLAFPGCALDDYEQYPRFDRWANSTLLNAVLSDPRYGVYKVDGISTMKDLWEKYRVDETGASLGTSIVYGNGLYEWVGRVSYRVLEYALYAGKFKAFKTVFGGYAGNYGSFDRVKESPFVGFKGWARTPNPFPGPTVNDALQPLEYPPTILYFQDSGSTFADQLARYGIDPAGKTHTEQYRLWWKACVHSMVESTGTYAKRHVKRVIPWLSFKGETVNDNGRNEVQTYTLTGSPTSGGFTLVFSGTGTTVSVAYNASAATLQAALVTLFGTGNVTVSKSGSVWTATWGGGKALTSIPQPTVGTNTMNGSGGLTIATATDGFEGNVGGGDLNCVVTTEDLIDLAGLSLEHGCREWCLFPGSGSLDIYTSYADLAEEMADRITLLETTTTFISRDIILQKKRAVIRALGLGSFGEDPTDSYHEARTTQ